MSRSTSIPALRLTRSLVAACLSASATLAPAATLTVNGSGDTVGVDGSCTLREAIQNMNGAASVNIDCVASGAYGTNDTIQFAIPGVGVRTISPASALPAVTATVLIDGYAQTGAVANSAANGWNGTILIELDGTSAGASADGLELLGSASTVRGLAIVNFNGNGIRFGAGVSGNSTGHTVAGCFLGLHPDGTAAGNNLYGVAFNALGNSDNNTLGGRTRPIATWCRRIRRAASCSTTRRPATRSATTTSASIRPGRPTAAIRSTPSGSTRRPTRRFATT